MAEAARADLSPEEQACQLVRYCPQLNLGLEQSDAQALCTSLYGHVPLRVSADTCIFIAMASAWLWDSPLRHPALLCRGWSCGCQAAEKRRDRV